MKFKNTILIILFTLMYSVSFGQNKSVQFQNLSFQELLEKSKKENKLIFIDCFASWCKYCKWMDKNVFINDTVADFYNQHFICAKFDMEKEGKDIALQYQIHAYPSLLYLNEKGETVYRVASERESSLFIEDGENALNPLMNTEAIYTKLQKENYQNPDSIYKYLSILKLAEVSYTYYENYLNTYFKKIPESELIKPNNWKLIRDFRNYLDYNEFKYVFTHQNLFEKVGSKDEIQYYIKKSAENALGFNLRKKNNQEYERVKKEIITWGDSGKEIVTRVEMQEAAKKKNWNQYAQLATLYIESFEKIISVSSLNKIAWNFYLHIDDKKLLIEAEKWAKRNIELDPKYAVMDTYASILYKLAKKKEAKIAAEKAIELAKKENQDYSPTEELLKKINALK